MKINMNSIVLVSIILLAFALRIYGIEWGLPSADYYFSYHADEVHYIRGLSQMNPAKLDFNPRYFNWGTWHYYELGGVIALASFLNFVKLNSDKNFYYSQPWELAKIYLTGRLLSVFFALMTIFLIYFIGKKIYNARTGLLASFFMAINPSHIVHSHYLKADISVTFWVTLLLLISIYLLETGKLKWYALSGVTAAFAMGSQQNGICFFHTFLCAHLLREYKSGVTLGFFKKALFSKKILIGCFTTVITYLIINPYLFLSTKEFLSALRDVLYRQKGGIDLVYRSDVLIDTLKAFGISLTYFFVVLGIIGIIFSIIFRSKKNILLIIWLIPYLSIMIIMGALNTRHQILIFPGIFLLAAGSASFFYSKMKRISVKFIFIILFSFFSLYTVIYSYAYDRGLSQKTIQKEASEWLVYHLKPKTVIGIASEPEITSCPTIIHQDYYYKESSFYRVMNFNSNIGDLKSKNPDFFIVSKRDTSFDLWKRPLFFSNFMKELENNYTVIKAFERYPSFLSFSFKPGIFISDWEIPFPVIYVLKNKQKDMQF